MSTSLEEKPIACARLPKSALSALADLRRREDVRVLESGDRVWVFWESGDRQVLRRLLPVSGVELFEHREGLWYRPGGHLPIFNVPEDQDAVSLSLAITPFPIVPEMRGRLDLQPARLTLTRDEQPRATRALRCRLAELAAWADSASTAELREIRAAREADQALLLGSSLPPILRAERFWGDRVLVPLGFCPEPAWPESALREALSVSEGELLLLASDRVEVIPIEVFQPLTRSGVRLALERDPS